MESAHLIVLLDRSAVFGYVMTVNHIRNRNPAQWQQLIEILSEGGVLVLTGAGISTDSGIPDYRGPKTIKRTRKPIQHGEFVEDHRFRRLYWSRSYVGWPRVRDAVPNDAHRAVADLEKTELVTGIITQNVDRLHHAAGSKNIVELHGTLETVSCLSCSTTETREQIQHRIGELNPEFYRRIAGPSPAGHGEDRLLTPHGDQENRLFSPNGHGEERLLSSVSEENCQLFTPEENPEGKLFTPDGDVEISEEYAETFQVPVCRRCGGVLKPDVVFFGGSVPKPIVNTCWEMVEQARSLLVIGSSLTVFSGFRFVKACAAQGKPIIIINSGPTRGDDLATVRIDAQLGEVLPMLVDAVRKEMMI
jgi:NAD-dependent SIR2 family protein deacetylase